MKKDHHKLLRSSLYVFLFLFIITLLPSAAAQVVSISPSTQTMSLYSDDNVSVNVQISGVTDLAGFQFDMSYNPGIINVTSSSMVTEGAFLSNGGADPTDWTSPKLSSGLAYDTACVRLKQSGIPYEGVNGSGVLASVTFSLLKGSTPPGRSYLNLSSVKLSDRDANIISYSSLINATIDTEECIDPETRPCPCNGTRVCSGNVWGACNGTCPSETCDGIDNDQDGYIDNAPGVTADYTLTQYCSINHSGICAVGNETCVAAFTWAGCPQPQTESCNAIDEDCDGDNTECLGDVTDNAGGSPDGCVDIFDITFITTRFGLTPADAGWDPRADLVPNNEIDIFDLVTVARDFGNGPACP